MFDVLKDVRKGKYNRTMVSNDEESTQNMSKYHVWKCCSAMFTNADMCCVIAVSADDMKGKVIVRDGVIVFDHVPIVTPNNDVLVSIGERIHTRKDR